MTERTGIPAPPARAARDAAAGEEAQRATVTKCTMQTVPAVLHDLAGADLPHARWLPLLEHAGINDSTAQMFMSVAAHPALANQERVHDLPPSWGTLYRLSRIPEDRLTAAIDAGQQATSALRHRRGSGRSPAGEHRAPELHRTAGGRVERQGVADVRWEGRWAHEARTSRVQSEEGRSGRASARRSSCRMPDATSCKSLLIVASFTPRCSAAFRCVHPARVSSSASCRPVVSAPADDDPTAGTPRTRSRHLHRLGGRLSTKNRNGRP